MKNIIKNKLINLWQMAININKNEEQEISDFLSLLIADNINGKISDNQAEYLLLKHYNNNQHFIKYENDLVTLRIKRVLQTSTFTFSKEYFYNLHKYLFTGIIEGAGQNRKFNAKRNEPILWGVSVLYTEAEFIEEQINECFNQSISIDSLNDIIDFISKLWQIHPFRNGNTRTVAVFLIKYLESKSLKINHDVFKNNFSYFRNALARNSFCEIKDYVPTKIYLENFFNNLLFINDEPLNNNELIYYENMSHTK